MSNEEIRSAIRKNRLRMYEVAQAVGISDSRFSVWLRTPLNDERRKRVEKAIAELTQSVKQ